MILETSRMSSMIWACALAFRLIVSIARAAMSLLNAPPSSIRDQPRIAVKGVRNS